MWKWHLCWPVALGSGSTNKTLLREKMFMLHSELQQPQLQFCCFTFSWDISGGCSHLEPDFQTTDDHHERLHSQFLLLSTWSCCWMNLWRRTAASRSSCSAEGHYLASHRLRGHNGVSSCWIWLSTSRGPWRRGSTARPRSAPCRWLTRPPWRWWRPSSLLAWRWSSPPCWDTATARTSVAGASGSRRRQSTMRTWTHPQRWAGRTSCRCRSTTVGLWLADASSSVSPGQCLSSSLCRWRPACSSYPHVSCRRHTWPPAGLAWIRRSAAGTTCGCVTRERSGRSRHFCSRAAACCMWSLTARPPRRSQLPEPVWWCGRWKGQRAKSFLGWWSVCWHHPAGRRALPSSLWWRGLRWPVQEFNMWLTEFLKNSRRFLE